MTFKYEKQKFREGYAAVMGCDEVGRGCLAGPVVASAVVFNQSKMGDKRLLASEIKDSKLLTPAKREELSENIKTCARAWSIAEVSSEIVDEINIHHASLLAMKKAVGKLACSLAGTFLFIDGKFTIPRLKLPQEAVVGGDNKILSIAAASIIAKVYRDRLMQRLDRDFPGYNFARHKGYATEHHRAMVLKYGLSPVHRQSFCQNLVI